MISVTAQRLINELVESAMSRAVAEERCTRAEINDAVNQFDADKAALERYVLRKERTIHRMKNELKAATPKTLAVNQRGDAVYKLLAVIAVIMLLTIVSCSMLIAKDKKEQLQKQLKPRLDCVRLIKGMT